MIEFSHPEHASVLQPGACQITVVIRFPLGCHGIVERALERVKEKPHGYGKGRHSPEFGPAHESMPIAL